MSGPYAYVCVFQSMKVPQTFMAYSLFWVAGFSVRAHLSMLAHAQSVRPSLPDCIWDVLFFGCPVNVGCRSFLGYKRAASFGDGVNSMSDMLCLKYCEDL